MNHPYTLFALLLGYLLGAIPSADIIARLRGRRIFEVGSSNMGAMNTARHLGYGWGVLVLLLDIGKGALAVWLGLLLTPAGWAPFAVAVAAVAGHAWSIFVGFRGGKALAVTLGVSLVLYPLAGLIALGLLIALVLLTKKTPLAASLAVITFAVLVPITTNGTAATLSAVAITLIVLSKHLPELIGSN